MDDKKEQAFQRAWAILDELPCEADPNSFYSRPATSSEAERNAWTDAAYKLEELSVSHEYVQFWARDAFVAIGDLCKALTLCKSYPFVSRHTSQANNKLSIKWALGLLVTGPDLLGVFGPRLTQYGRDNIEPISQYLTLKLSQIQANGARNLFAEWAEDAHEIDAGYTLFSGHASCLITKPPRGVSFHLSRRADEFSKQIIREAENTWREENGIPRIGEGWVSETALFYEIKASFSEYEVLQHASPTWLGRQHLDVFIPEMKVGVEYQGIQHDRPVEYFGGEAAYHKTKMRDKAKKAKCTRNGVRIVYVREGYDQEKVIEAIRAAAA